MKITVLLSSGDEDEWEDAADAIEHEGSLAVVYDIEDDEVPGDIKTLTITREIENEALKTETFQVAAQYAPGMWMRVSYE